MSRVAVKVVRSTEGVAGMHEFTRFESQRSTSATRALSNELAMISADGAEKPNLTSKPRVPVSLELPLG